jgi:hypothetical protein
VVKGSGGRGRGAFSSRARRVRARGGRAGLTGLRRRSRGATRPRTSAGRGRSGRAPDGPPRRGAGTLVRLELGAGATDATVTLRATPAAARTARARRGAHRVAPSTSRRWPGAGRPRSATAAPRTS